MRRESDMMSPTEPNVMGMWYRYLLNSCREVVGKIGYAGFREPFQQGCPYGGSVVGAVHHFHAWLRQNGTKGENIPSLEVRMGLNRR